MCMGLNDNDIKKALECCLAPKHDCSYCLLEKEVHCTSLLHKNILALINRQQAEIERLKGNLFTISNACMQRRNEAIKEFAERLKKRAKLVARIKDNTRIWAVTEDDIDRVDAEMVGEQ